MEKEEKKEPGKSQLVSVLLAVFLSLWTWLYAYQREGLEEDNGSTESCPVWL